MKRRELVRHLTEQGCTPLREGSRHSVFHNPKERRIYQTHEKTEEKGNSEI